MGKKLDDSFHWITDDTDRRGDSSSKLRLIAGLANMHDETKKRRNERMFPQQLINYMKSPDVSTRHEVDQAAVE